MQIATENIIGIKIMKDEFVKELQEICPHLYVDMYGSPQKTCMTFGIATGNGWYSLIKDLSLQLEALILEMPEEDRYKYRASTVKEKMGSLRFYMWSSTNSMNELINRAEERSYHICEGCGAPGKMRGEQWYYVACDEHTKPRDKD